MVTLETKTSPCINDPLTARTVAEAYCKDRNKAQAMLMAGYSVSYANSGLGQGIVYSHIQTKTAIAEIMADTRAAVAEVLRWEREDNLKHQYKQIDRYNTILAAHPDNLQALQGLNQVLRELNASNGQHSQTVITEPTRPIPTAQELEAGRAAAKAYTDALTRKKVVSMPVPTLETIQATGAAHTSPERDVTAQEQGQTEAHTETNPETGAEEAGGRGRGFEGDGT